MKEGTRLDYLDGLRGLAALWVIVGHTLHFTKFYIPIIYQPEFAVDLFMMISGFLMFYQAKNREAAEPFSEPKNWTLFWIRRYFRIAPVYYMTLAIVWLTGPLLLEWHLLISKEIRASAYTDQSLDNLFTHLTFVFGVLPYYHIRTPLPDWSLGLEMQFYALFPFIVLAMMRFGKIATVLILIGFSLALWALFPAFMGAFKLASFLFLKINIFLAGILIAAALFCEKKYVWPHIIGAMAIVGIHLFTKFGISSSVFRIFMTAGFVLLAVHHRMELPVIVSNTIGWFGRMLGTKPFHMLGEISYGIYLYHLLILIPVAGYVISTHGGNLSPLAITLIVLFVTLLLTAAVAIFSYFAIEKPGIQLGRSIVKKIWRQAVKA